ncbi:hypothetical protein JMJ77_0006084, partial [Colletotrichum scovillei]
SLTVRVVRGAPLRPLSTECLNRKGREVET